MSHVSLQPLSPLATSWPQAVALYEQAFPPCERRDVRHWHRLATDEKDFHLFQVNLEGTLAQRKGIQKNLEGTQKNLESTFAGFVSYWELGEVIYVEHFAICANQRGGGVGGAALSLLCEAVAPRPILLEVELPNTPMAARRIGFYERHGFELLDADYVQPPYRAGDTWLPLRLMTTDADFLTAHLDDVKRCLYTKVYGLASTNL